MGSMVRRLLLPVLLILLITTPARFRAQQLATCSAQLSSASIVLGVPALSNGNSMTTTCSCIGDTYVDKNKMCQSVGYPNGRCAKGVADETAGCRYGIRYQCVEFVRRFYSLRSDTANQIDTSAWDGLGTGADFLSDSGSSPVPLSDLTPVLNKAGAALPNVGDTIVFHGGDSGHVAIVSGRETNSSGAVTGIDIVEQNFSNSGVHTLAVLADGTVGDYVKGGPTTSKKRGDYTIVGWLTPTHVVSSPPLAPVIGNLSTRPSPTMVGTFYIDITNASNVDTKSVFLYLVGPQCSASNGTYDCEVKHTDLSISNAASLTGQVNIINQGDYYVYLQNGATGTPSAGWHLVVQAPVPSITGLIPSSLAIYSTGQTITINGSGFTPTAALTLNNQPHFDTYVSPNQMTMVTTLADVSSAGPLPVVVTNLPPGGGSSTAYNLTITTATPIMSVTPSSLSFGDQKKGTASTKQPVTVQNTGSGSLAVPSVSLSGSNAGDFSVSNGCTTPLSAAASCQVQIGFTPGATGSRNATMTIASAGATGSPATVSLSGTGTSSGVQITSTISPPSPITLGTQVLISGTASPGAVVTANESVNGGSPTPYVQKAADSAGNWTDGQFTPKVAGNYQEVFTDNAGDSQGSLQFTVTALPPPVINSLMPTQLPHANYDQTLTIKGTGFVSGLTVIPNYPGASNLTGSQAVVSPDGMSIAVKITVNGIGNWPLQVKNPDGQTSNTEILVVQ